MIIEVGDYKHCDYRAFYDVIIDTLIIETLIWLYHKNDTSSTVNVGEGVSGKILGGGGLFTTRIKPIANMNYVPTI